MMRPEQTDLVTDRLHLRKLINSDWEMISYLRTDPIVNQYVQRASAETQEKALAFISRINLEITESKIFYWCLTKKDSTMMIGSICLWKLSEDGEMAEIGYDLSPEFHGQGLMSEAMHAMMDFGKNKMGLKKIEAYTQKNNPASIGLLKRYGFRLNSEKSCDENALNLIYEKIM